jgi:hypothetical protein
MNCWVRVRNMAQKASFSDRSRRHERVGNWLADSHSRKFHADSTLVTAGDWLTYQASDANFVAEAYYLLSGTGPIYCSLLFIAVPVPVGLPTSRRS